MKPVWYPDWTGKTCLLVGGGSSTTKHGVELFKKRVIVCVINNAYQLAPWADMLYAADGRWWNEYPDARRISGYKVTPDKIISSAFKKGFNVCDVDLADERADDRNTIIVDRPGVLGRGGHSGHQLLNLVIQCGCRNVLLMGYDLCGEHWHSKHTGPLRNPRDVTLEKWAARMDALAPQLKELGVSVTNLSRTSALKAYPIADPKDVLREAA